MFKWNKRIKWHGWQVDVRELFSGNVCTHERVTSWPGGGRRLGWRQSFWNLLLFDCCFTERKAFGLIYIIIFCLKLFSDFLLKWVIVYVKNVPLKPKQHVVACWNLFFFILLNFTKHSWTKIIKRLKRKKKTTTTDKQTGTTTLFTLYTKIQAIWRYGTVRKITTLLLFDKTDSFKDRL